jgi:hypothetical protein
MHKCYFYLTADCEIENQTNRIVYLNIDLAIEIEMLILGDSKYLWINLATMYEN